MRQLEGLPCDSSPIWTALVWTLVLNVGLCRTCHPGGCQSGARWNACLLPQLQPAGQALQTVAGMLMTHASVLSNHLHTYVILWTGYWLTHNFIDYIICSQAACIALMLRNLRLLASQEGGSCQSRDSHRLTFIRRLSPKLHMCTSADQQDLSASCCFGLR